MDVNNVSQGGGCSVAMRNNESRWRECRSSGSSERRNKYSVERWSISSGCRRYIRKGCKQNVRQFLISLYFIIIFLLFCGQNDTCKNFSDMAANCGYLVRNPPLSYFRGRYDERTGTTSYVSCKKKCKLFRQCVKRCGEGRIYRVADATDYKKIGRFRITPPDLTFRHIIITM